MKVLNEKEIGNKINGSSLKGYISITYPQLVSILGEPTYSAESGDSKVQKEWVVEFEGNVFTIYDWKTFDEDYTINELDEFHVGGKTDANNFIEALSDKNK